jgi:hypothetical protein
LADIFVIGAVVGAFVPFGSLANLGYMGERVIDEGGMVRWPSDEINALRMQEMHKRVINERGTSLGLVDAQKSTEGLCITNSD